jgi:hypothetical protein
MNDQSLKADIAMMGMKMAMEAMIMAAQVMKMPTKPFLAVFFKISASNLPDEIPSLDCET